MTKRRADILGAKQPFWRTKSLSEMSKSEWESLCDGCGRCCLVKLEFEDDGEIAYTDVACKLLDLGTCRCTDYTNRRARVPDCLQLTPKSLKKTDWLPPTCAYKLIANKEDLPWWHPLVSGSDKTVIEAGISVMSKVLSEAEVDEDDLIDHVVIWPDWPATKGGHE